MKTMRVKMMMRNIIAKIDNDIVLLIVNLNFNYNFYSLFEYPLNILSLPLVVNHLFPLLRHQLVVHLALPLLPLLVLPLHPVHHRVEPLTITDVLLSIQSLAVFF